jgi:hypothetical protein
MDDWGSIPGKGRDFFSSPLRSDRLWGPIRFLGVKRLMCEADNSPPSSSKVKNVWSYTSNPPYVFMAWFLIKNRKTLPYEGVSKSFRTESITK